MKRLMHLAMSAAGLLLILSFLSSAFAQMKQAFDPRAIKDVIPSAKEKWDSVFKHNIYGRLKGEAIRNVPPTFCGCGYFYLAVNNRGEIFPCDFFANFPEFKIGDVFNGFNETSLFFRKMGER